MRGFTIRAAAILLGFTLLQPGSAAPPAPDEGPLARLVQIAFANGYGGPLNGRICTALGITDKNEPLPVEQLSSAVGSDNRSFNVSRHRGRLDVIIALRTKEETLAFLTSAGGVLEKAVLEKKDQPLRQIPLGDAQVAFEKEKSWWLDNWVKTHYPDSAAN
jgi:hypothetical protein